MSGIREHRGSGLSSDLPLLWPQASGLFKATPESIQVKTAFSKGYGSVKLLTMTLPQRDGDLHSARLPFLPQHAGRAAVDRSAVITIPVLKCPPCPRRPSATQTAGPGPQSKTPRTPWDVGEAAGSGGTCQTRGQNTEMPTLPASQVSRGIHPCAATQNCPFVFRSRAFFWPIWAPVEITISEGSEGEGRRGPWGQRAAAFRSGQAAPALPEHDRSG